MKKSSLGSKRTVLITRLKDSLSSPDARVHATAAANANADGYSCNYWIESCVKCKLYSCGCLDADAAPSQRGSQEYRKEREERSHQLQAAALATAQSYKQTRSVQTVTQRTSKKSNRLYLTGIGGSSMKEVYDMIVPYCPIIMIQMSFSGCIVVLPSFESVSLLISLFDGAEVNGNVLHLQCTPYPEYMTRLKHTHDVINKLKIEQSRGRGVAGLLYIANQHRDEMTSHSIGVLIGLVGKQCQRDGKNDIDKRVIEWLDVLIAAFLHGHCFEGRGLMAQIALGLAKMNHVTKHENITSRLRKAFELMKGSIMNIMTSKPSHFEPQSIAAFAWSFAKASFDLYYKSSDLFDAIAAYVINGKQKLDARSTSQLAWSFGKSLEITHFHSPERVELRRKLYESASWHIKALKTARGTDRFDDQCMTNMAEAIPKVELSMTHVIHYLYREKHILNFLVDVAGELQSKDLSRIPLRRLTNLIWAFSKTGDKLRNIKSIQTTVILLVEDVKMRLLTSPNIYDLQQLAESRYF